MSINQIIVDVMVVFMVIAAIDRCLGNRFGLGAELDKGLDAIGPMCIPMVGMILLAPMIGDVLTPLVSPFFHMLGADPAMFATAILACDMGGYSLAISMASTPEAGQFAGCILGCSLGRAISFLIPVGTSMVRKDYPPCFAVGVLAGIVTVPIGLVVGGIAAGYDLSMVLHNTLPILILSLAIALGLWWAQDACIRLFAILGRLLVAVATIGFAIGIIQELTPLVVIPGLTSVLDGVKVVGSVAIVLCGAYPMLYIITSVWRGPIRRLGHTMGIDQNATASIFAGLANIMPILGQCNNMSPAGVTVALAFAVSGSCMFGDHLGFIASVDQSMIVPMILSKIAGCLTATALAVLLCKRNHYSNKHVPEPVPEQQPEALF